LLENPKFATDSMQTPLRELRIKKNLFSTSEFTKIRHFEFTKTKNKKLPLLDSSYSSPHFTPFGASSPQL